MKTLSIPTREQIKNLLFYGSIRILVSFPLIGMHTIYQASKLLCQASEISIKVWNKALIQPLEASLWGIEAAQTPVTIEASLSPIDLLTAIEQDEKELMLIGEKGTGKSTIAQYLAYTLGGKIKVYEPEGTPTDWQGLEVIGKGENWKAINQSMQSDLDHITSQMQARRERGDAALANSERIIIGEEYPEIAQKCDHSEEWLERHARRGRKAKTRLILLSQYDRAAAWGLEGKLDLLECFYRLRLGKKATAHAKKLKQQNLTNWLREDRSHALLDDSPIVLPPYSEMIRAIRSPANLLTSSFPQRQERLTTLEAETTTERDLQPSEALQKQDFTEENQPQNWEDCWEEKFWQTWQRLNDGQSNYKIAKEVFGILGGTTYQRLCERLDGVKDASSVAQR